MMNYSLHAGNTYHNIIFIGLFVSSSLESLVDETGGVPILSFMITLLIVTTTTIITANRTTEKTNNTG